MDRHAADKGGVGRLYPMIQPFDVRHLPVGEGHVLYVEQCGNPEGIPVVVLHGGPGGGCSPYMRRFFDPERFRIVLFDQRGCGRSTPHASLDANTTWHLVRDIEAIRAELGLAGWHVFGGSWGATLALIYAQEHPEAVMSLILRGVFLMTEPELSWFYGGGAGLFWPEFWARFVEPIPEAERGNLIAAYHRRLFSGDAGEELRFARIWSGWENALATIETAGMNEGASAEYARAFARIEAQYFLNRGWLEPGQGILERVERLRGIPGHIVQGRYDMICPPVSAQALAAQWLEARLCVVPVAGHAISEPGIARQLVAIMDRIAQEAG